MNRPVRQGYNAKARQSTAGSRKKGKRKAKVPEATEPAQDPNAEVISRKSDEQKELDRKERLRQEVRPTYFLYSAFLDVPVYVIQLIAQSESKVNSKKKKRLEKYIVRMNYTD